MPEEWIDLSGTIVEIGKFSNVYSDPGSGDSSIIRTGKYWNIWEAGPDGAYRLKGEAYGYFRPQENPGVLTVDLGVDRRVNGGSKQTSGASAGSFDLMAYSALMEKGVRDRDGVLRSAFFTDDARVMPFADSTRTGMDQIKPYLIAYDSAPVTIDSIDVHPYHIEDRGDYILEYTKFSVRFRTPGQQGSMAGKGIRIWKRQADHSLRIFREIGLHNLDNDLNRTRACLEKFRSDYRQGLLKGQPGMISSYYSKDVRIMPEFQKTLMGREHAGAYLRAFSERFSIKEYMRTEMEILELGQRVVESGLFHMKVTLRSSGKDYEMNGKYLDIWDPAGEDGQDPVLVSEAWNYDERLDIEEEMRISRPSAGGCRKMQPHSPVNSAVSFELAAFNRLMEIAVTEHDAGLWSRIYAADILYCYSRTPLIRGRDNMDRFLEEHVRHLPIFEKLDIRNDRIDDLGGFIIEWASHIAVWRDGGSSGVNTGKDIRIWRRDKDGYLRIFRTIAMYD